MRDVALFSDLGVGDGVGFGFGTCQLGRTPLLLAAMQGKGDVVAALLDASASTEDVETNVRVRCGDGGRLRHCALLALLLEDPGSP
jgi:hypothetical protein